MSDIDQRGFDNQRSAWLSGAEAAAFLGIKRETLYAYASRGLVRSEPGDHGRGRRYRREDLERLKARHDARAGHGPVAAGALRWGEPVLESALTAITARGPAYRGRPATELAEELSFEAVAERLWAESAIESNSSIAPWNVDGLGLRAASLDALLPDASHPLTTLALAVPALAAADPDRFDASPDAERRRARALVLRMAAIAGARVDSDRRANDARLREAIQADSVARAFLIAFGVRPTARAERAVDRALILIADHELNVSAFAVRVTASAGADLYACVSAGLAALSGPRHGGACDRTEALVAEVARPERARAALHERARRGDEVPGFGHPLYPDGDPRNPPLLDDAQAIAPRSLALRTLLAIIDAMRAAGREPPTVDTGLVALAAALGLPQGAAAGLFAVGRTAGWIAHAFEQRAAGFMLRPRARYVGP